jgi:ribosomal protein S18 acetylase RimI-like enzyme
MAELRFVPATLADLPVLQRLAHAIWHAHYPGIISIEQVDYMLAHMYADATIAAELARGVTWELILADDTPIGFLSHSHVPDERRVNLHKLYVLPAWHGRGVGQAGLARVQDHARARSATTVSLYVNKHNAKAIRAYARAGFHIAESLVNDFGAGFVMDDYRMERRLPGSAPGAADD